MTRAVEIAVQVTIIFIGSTAFQVTHIGGREWGISLALGFASIPLGALIRLLPNQPFERLFILMRLLVVLTLLVSCFVFGLQCISIAHNTLEALTQHIIFILLSVIVLGGERH
jgi:hypothetical protein